MSGVDSAFAYKTIMFSVVIMLGLSMFISAFVPSIEPNNENDVLEDYYDFTGASRSQTKESVWVLKGIYTPYQGDRYSYTEDGWLYGERISTYSPVQYLDSPFEYVVSYVDEDGMYRYKFDSADYDPDKGLGHRGGYYRATQADVDKDDDDDITTVGQIVKRSEPGDLYTSVVFDLDHQSDIFFTKSTKYNSDGSLYRPDTDQPFYYEFNGWRYSFSPLSNSWTVDGDGNKREIIATTTSLSLIWYYYYTADGIAGQLVLSGSDEGVSYLSGDQIVRAFDSTTSTARFDMTFNGGVQMGIYIRIDPYALSNLGYTVKECYDLGYWSIMVTSISTDSDAYSGSDFSINIWNLFETIVKLMTFNYADFGMSAFAGIVCSFIIVIPLYAGLISLALGSWQAMALVGIMGIVQTLVSVISNFSLF